MSSIYMVDPVWFSPLNVLYHSQLIMNTAPPEEIKTKRFRKVIEAHNVAQMLVGVMVKENREYWMQLVEDEAGSPDIRTIRYVGNLISKFDRLEQVDVEVVEYESHAGMPIPDFIVDKKFSKKKSYDENTVILCHLGQNVGQAYLPDGKYIQEVMSKLNTNCGILFLAKEDPYKNLLRLYTLKPIPGLLLEYDPLVEIIQMNSIKKLKGVVKFKLGTRRMPEYYPENRNYPFEKLGYTPNKNGIYEFN